VDTNTMTIQYFETLKRMAEGASTKWIFPLELTKLLEGLTVQRK
jgi:hypothetical protein